MEKCKTCEWFKSTYPNQGYCKLWDEYMGANDSCDDWEERYD